MSYTPQSTPPSYAPAPQDKTNTMSIIAIILGFVVPIGGIIFGFIALSQIKRTGEKGRGLALTGIIVGAAITLLYLILGLASLALFSAAVHSGAYTT